MNGWVRPQAEMVIARGVPYFIIRVNCCSGGWGVVDRNGWGVTNSRCWLTPPVRLGFTPRQKRATARGGLSLCALIVSPCEGRPSRKRARLSRLFTAESGSRTGEARVRERVAWYDRIWPSVRSREPQQLHCLRRGVWETTIETSAGPPLPFPPGKKQYSYREHTVLVPGGGNILHNNRLIPHSILKTIRLSIL